MPVDPLRPVSVSLTPDSVTMRAVGDTARFVAEVRDQHGAILAGDWVAWSSSDTSVVTLDATGLARAAGDGLATILATAGTATDRAVVLVTTPRGALADFYEATVGAQWLNNTGWLTDEPLASWHGVTPHEDNPRASSFQEWLDGVDSASAAWSPARLRSRGPGYRPSPEAHRVGHRSLHGGDFLVAQFGEPRSPPGGETTPVLHAQPHEQ